jgi:hypothetical protein
MNKFYATDPMEEKILRRIPREILILALIIALLSLLFFDPMTSLFIFAGGLLSALSFIWLKQAITRFLFLEKKNALRASVVLYFLRLLLIIAVFSIIILLFSKRIIAFAAGFSTIIAVILVESIAVLFSLKSWKA